MVSPIFIYRDEDAKIGAMFFDIYIGIALVPEIVGVNTQFRSLSRNFLCRDIQCFVRRVTSLEIAIFNTLRKRS